MIIISKLVLEIIHIWAILVLGISPKLIIIGDGPMMTHSTNT